MQLELMRFVMQPRPQSDIEERRHPSGRALTREEWLREMFSGSISFQHRGIEFHFVPIKSDRPEIIVGRVGRQVVARENDSPATGFLETQHEAWRAALVLIDPRHHDDGQTAAVEVLREVGRPLAILDSVAQSINSRPVPETYFLEVNAIADPQTFWDFEKENRGQIVDVVFELQVPNMFGIRDDLDGELKDLRDHEKARRVKIGIQNEDGLNLETERVANTVNHTLDGGGSLTARTAAGRRFNSRGKAKHVRVDVELPGDTSPPSLGERVRRAVLGVFGI